MDYNSIHTVPSVASPLFGSLDDYLLFFRSLPSVLTVRCYYIIIPSLFDSILVSENRF